MNILPFILAVLLVLSYGASGVLQKHVLSSTSERAFLGLRRAERRLLRNREAAQFQQLPGIPTKLPKKEKTNPEPKPVPLPTINPSCARLNLFPLIVEGKQKHLHLHTMALKTLHTFYPHVDSKQLLDAMLKAAQHQLEKKETVPLETLKLNNPELQNTYYTLLKGTKHCNLSQHTGHPALVDYFKIERASTQICLYHAHPNLMAPFFGVENAPVLYQKLHTDCKPGVEIEAIFHLIDSRELRFVDPGVWKLLDLTKPRHSKEVGSGVVLAEDPSSGVVVRRKLSQ